jgi:2-iminobutanoate/2-iminopropanoate deaminase
MMKIAGSCKSLLAWCLLTLLAAQHLASAPSLSGAPSHTIVYVGVPGLPISEVVRVDNMLYLSGQIGFDSASNGLITGGIRAETRQAMNNVKRVLDSQGSSMDSLIHCTVMLVDMNEWGDMNNVYAGYFDSHFPARSTLGVNGLALGARVEIVCTALIQ